MSKRADRFPHRSAWMIHQKNATLKTEPYPILVFRCPTRKGAADSACHAAREYPPLAASTVAGLTVDMRCRAAIIIADSAADDIFPNLP